MSGFQSALHPAGPHAERIGDLWNVFLAVSTVVYVLVMIYLLLGLFRRTQATERGASRVVWIASGLTVLVLFALLGSSIYASRGIPDSKTHALNIAVTGRQWWWQVDYELPDLSKRFTTANEIVIPVGTPVHVTLHAPDVIHSLWIPNLNGKQDLLPGHDGDITLLADRAGVYRGQCAEFCGEQHAKMALWVTALKPRDYTKWQQSQQQPSNVPSTPQQWKGQEVFMNSPCPLCHTIAGTDASGKTAPDLTHFASRRSIAAGTLPNRRGYLAGWILDPQHIKPGNQMPPMVLEHGQLQPLLEYLESLQ